MRHQKFYSLVYLCGNGNPLEIWKAMSIFTCNFCTFSLECIFQTLFMYKIRFHSTKKEKPENSCAREKREELYIESTPVASPRPPAPQRLSFWPISCQPSSSSATNAMPRKAASPGPQSSSLFASIPVGPGRPCLAVSEVKMTEVQLAAEGEAPCSSPQY